MSEFECDHDRDIFSILEEMLDRDEDDDPDFFDQAEREIERIKSECEQDCAINGTPI